MKLRFAPSPTGYLHVGNTRTLLVNWLFAKHNNAAFVLRFDDTDTERSKQEYETQIVQDLAWLGVEYSQTFKQSKRLDLYARMAEKLKVDGRLYPCYETKEELDLKRKILLTQGKPPIYDRAALKLSDSEIKAYEAQGRTPHWRFKLSDKAITWKDMAHGELRFEATNLSDPVVIREDGNPLFTFSGMVDDLDMGITHIIRGDDHITNTAIQIQILEALGGKSEDFTFAHIPLLTGAQGEGLSKRLGSLSLMDLKAQGYESLALCNYLAGLGMPEELPLSLTTEELAKAFPFEKLGKSTPRFDEVDLKRMNAKILHHIDFAHISQRLNTEGFQDVTQDFWDTIKGNLEMIADIKPFQAICFGEVTPVSNDPAFLNEALAHLPETPWDQDTWTTWTTALKEKTGRKGKELFMPLRQALTAEDHGPEMKNLLPFIGRDKVIARLSGQKA